MASFALQAMVYAAAVAAVTPLLGSYMARVFSKERTFLDRVLRPFERSVYRFCGIAEGREQSWTQYARSLLAFNAVGLFVLYALLRLQGVLPLNPQGVPGQDAWLAFNTAVSFVTNTNWQAYSGESGVSYLTQMLGLTWQNFVSAATGLAVAVALVRGLVRKSGNTLGNFWVDMVRGTLWVLLPVSLVAALAFSGMGVVQNLRPADDVTTVEGAEQRIAQGPVASQEAVKMFGVNGGGFFNANSAHPFENPTPLSNFLQTVLILAIPAGLTYTFGKWAGDRRQGWVLFAAMLALYLAGLAGMYAAEQRGNPILARAGAGQEITVGGPGGNMEGKEVRFGIAATTIFANATTGASCGAVNGMHDSFTPWGGGIAMLNIALGELIFGGVGVGLAAMLVFALLAVFIAGLMVGRTPEYLGKKIQAREIQMSMLAVLAVAFGTLAFAAFAVALPVGLAALNNAGPHGLSEILYAFTSAAGNNGSAFAGLGANSDFFNVTLGLGMLIGRFLFIIPVLAIAGSLVRKPSVPPSAGTFPTTGALFVALLIGTVLIVGALTYFPVYALGPIVEQSLMLAGRTF